MSEAPWLTLAAILSLAGMAWLALAMTVHWEQVMQRPADEATGLRRGGRLAGMAALTLALLACLMSDPPAMAVLVWVMLIAAAALTIALWLAWHARSLRFLWPRPDR